MFFFTGVYTVGNVGRIEGSFYWPLLGASSFYVFKYLDMDGISLAAFVSSSFFEAKSAQWRRTPSPKHHICRFHKLAIRQFFFNKWLIIIFPFTEGHFSSFCVSYSTPVCGVLSYILTLKSPIRRENLLNSAMESPISLRRLCGQTLNRPSVP